VSDRSKVLYCGWYRVGSHREHRSGLTRGSSNSSSSSGSLVK
jgi:hypothetical protein